MFSVQHTHFQVVSEFGKKQLSGKQNKTLTCPTQQVMFWAESSQCITPLFNRGAGQVEVPAGQVNFRGRMEPKFHPDVAFWLPTIEDITHHVCMHAGIDCSACDHWIF